MKTYNRALDYLTLALDQVIAGNTEVAAKLLVKAARQADTPKALAILEASNAQAYQHQVEARAKAEAEEKAKIEAAAAEAKKADLKATTAGARLVAAGEDDLSDLVGDEGAGEVDDPEIEEEIAEPEAKEVSDEEVGNAIASVLAGMVKQKAAKAAK